jgi:hexokinase
MVINMEWDNFKSLLLPINEFDEVVDFRIFEKLVSDMYLRGVIQRILLKVVEKYSI